MTKRAKLGSSGSLSATSTLATKEFDLPDTVEFTRLEFLRTAGSAALFAALGISVASCGVTNTNDEGDGDGQSGGGGGSTGITVNGSIVTIDLGTSTGQPLAPAGGWLLSTQAGILAVNIDGTTIRAFTNVCTHASCDNSWEFSSSVFTCTCHNSKFNTAGEVIQGPATRDLAEFSVSRNGNIVTIDKA